MNTVCSLRAGGCGYSTTLWKKKKKKLQEINEVKAWVTLKRTFRMKKRKENSNKEKASKFEERK